MAAMDCSRPAYFTDVLFSPFFRGTIPFAVKSIQSLFRLASYTTEALMKHKFPTKTYVYFIQKYLLL